MLNSCCLCSWLKAAWCTTLKRYRTAWFCAWNIDCLAWVSFFAFFLIWQFVSLFLHSLYSFHNRKQQLTWDGWVTLYLRCSKGAGPFLWVNKILNQGGKCIIIPVNICTQQIFNLTDQFSSNFTLLSWLVLMVWPTWKVSNLSGLICCWKYWGNRGNWGAWFCLCLTVKSLQSQFHIIKYWAFQNFISCIPVFNSFLSYR